MVISRKSFLGAPKVPKNDTFCTLFAHFLGLSWGGRENLRTFLHELAGEGAYQQASHFRVFRVFADIPLLRKRCVFSLLFGLFWVFAIFLR